MKQVSVGLVHFRLCFYLPAVVLLSRGKSKAKFEPNIVPCALSFPHPKAKPEASGELYQ